MAKRTLQDLQRQYCFTVADSNKKQMPVGPRGRGPGGPRPTGKPKNTSETIKRLWSYVSSYKLSLILVVACMLISTVSSLIGSYMLAQLLTESHWQLILMRI